MVVCVLPKDEARVRFSYPAPSQGPVVTGVWPGGSDRRDIKVVLYNI